MEVNFRPSTDVLGDLRADMMTTLIDSGRGRVGHHEVAPAGSARSGEVPTLTAMADNLMWFGTS
jgi:hypothetical protein